MSKRADILQNNYGAATVGVVGADIRLRVSFNTWYSDNSGHASGSP